MKTVEISEAKLYRLTVLAKSLAKAGSSGVLPGTAKTLEILETLKKEVEEIQKALAE